MSMMNFIETITNDRAFRLQISAYKYISPLGPKYMRLALSDSLRDVLRNRGDEALFSL